MLTAQDIIGGGTKNVSELNNNKAPGKRFEKKSHSASEIRKFKRQGEQVGELVCFERLRHLDLEKS